MEQLKPSGRMGIPESRMKHAKHNRVIRGLDDLLIAEEERKEHERRSREWLRKMQTW